jgi:predicted RNA-binding Zn-ribbon protein involved in translation (DUF1610 family)
MKFLCVSCDEAMKLKRTEGPDKGSMAVVFECPACGWATAMLTNTMETQMVRSLGVKIGGRGVPAEPMEMVRSSLKNTEPADAPEKPSSEANGSKCPFSNMVEDAFANQDEKIVWTKTAEDRMANIPSFARPMARKGVEMHAIEKGYTEINDAVLDEVKDRFGM